MIDVNNLFYKLTEKHCEHCKAMTHANKIEEELKNKKIIDDWKKLNGIKDDKQENDDAIESWTDVIKLLLLKPYIYVAGCLLAISPYGVEIIKAILEFFSK